MKNELSPGERFWLWRRRKGLTTRRAGEVYGVSADRVLEWERHGRRDVPWVRLRAPIEEGERLVVLRRRAGWTQRRLAEFMGVSPWTVIQWEKGRGEVGRGIEFVELLK